jgi:catechol 2,3-dioxygenase-like lactoylglutathione lyase family enzyme
MAWCLDHVNVVAHDVRRSADFYSSVFGMSEKPFPAAEEHPIFSTAPEALANFPEPDGDRLGLHVALPDVTIARQLNMWLDPIVRGHFAIRVDDIERVKANLDRRGDPYIEMGEWAAAGRHQLYAYDPDRNVLEINQKKEGERP